MQNHYVLLMLFNKMAVSNILINCFLHLLWFTFARGLPGDSMVLSLDQDGSLPANITTIPGDLESLLTKSHPVLLTEKRRLIQPNIEITSMVCDQGNNTLFLSEVNTNGIYRINHFNSWFNDSRVTYSHIHQGISSAELHITYDWINQNLYWTDGQFKWIILQPAFTEDDLMYKPIITQNLNRPLAIAVNSKKRYIFWSDIAETPRIERSSLSGESRKILVHRGLGLPNSMVADETSNSIFWTDDKRDTIETCTDEGQNRRVITRINLAVIKSIALYKDIVCVTDSDNKKVRCYRTGTGESTQTISGFKSTVRAIALYDSTSRTVVNVCKSKMCHHMCVTDPDGAAKCICRTGFTLLSDGLTCKDEKREYGTGILISNSSSICIYEVRLLTGFDHDPVCFNNMQGNINITFMATDWRNSYIYYADSNNKIISVYNRVTSTTSTLTTTETVSGLAYDWIDENLYWSESDSGSIRMVSTVTRSTRIVFTNITALKELVVNPHSGKLFWIATGNSGPEIQSAFKNGSGLKTFVKEWYLGNPERMLFDTTSQRIFWLSSGRVKSVNTNGTDYKHHYYTNSDHFTVYKEYLVWISTGLYIYASQISSTASSSSIKSVSKMKTITEIVIVDPALQPLEKGACEVMNGGCEDICLTTGSGRSCECSLGLKLQNDKMSCSSVPVEDNFLLVVDYNHDKIYQIRMDNAEIIALDLPNVERPTAVAYNNKTKTVYWSDGTHDRIRQSTLTGENVSTIYYIGSYWAEDIAIDYSSGNIYFVETALIQAYIKVMRKGINPLTILSNVYRPRKLALYPSKGYMFWSDYGNKHIKRASMDGTGVLIIDSFFSTSPYGLTIDYTDDRLYWIDGTSHTIESMDIHGNNRRRVVSDIGATPMHIVLDGAYLYYTAWQKQKITKINKNTGVFEAWMNDNVEFGRLGSLAISSGENQPANSLCSNANGQCSTYCLPTVSGRRCACEDQVNLKADGKTCEGVLQCPVTLTNGYVDSSCVRYPERTCNYSCASGYKKNAIIKEITCNNNGNWKEHQLDLCIPITCDLVVPNGNFTGGCTGTLNHHCQYTCNDGFKANTLITHLQCISTGFWNPSTAQICTRVQCDSYIMNGHLTPSCNRYYGDVCNYTCDSGYRKSLSKSLLSCLASGKWNESVNTLCSEIKCPAIINGGKLLNCPKTSIGSMCTFNCNDGFKKKDGVSTIFCLSSGNWSEQNLCIPETTTFCNTTIPNGNFDDQCDGNLKTSCEFECGVGFAKANGVKSVTCLSSGQWTVPLHQLCTAIKCNVDETIANGFFVKTCNGTVGSSCIFACNEGFNKKNDGIVHCQSNGQWDIQFRDLCTAIPPCPGTIPNGELDKMCGRKPTSICSFKCNKGYTKQPNTNTITCKQDSVWNESLDELCKGAEKETTGKSQGNDQTGPAVGGGVGGLIVLAAVAVVIIFICRRRQQLRRNETYSDMKNFPSEFDITNPAYDATELVIPRDSRPISETYAEIQEVPHCDMQCGKPQNTPLYSLQVPVRSSNDYVDSNHLSGNWSHLVRIPPETTDFGSPMHLNTDKDTVRNPFTDPSKEELDNRHNEDNFDPTYLEPQKKQSATTETDLMSELKNKLPLKTKPPVLPKPAGKNVNKCGLPHSPEEQTSNEKSSDDSHEYQKLKNVKQN